VAEQPVSADTAGERLGIRNRPFALLAAIAGLVVLHEGAPLFAPILVSVLLAYALEPFVRALIRLRLPRVIAAIVVYAMIAAAAIGLGRTAQAQVATFLNDLPPALASMRTVLQRRAAAGRPGPLDRIQDAVADLQTASGGASPPPSAAVKRVVAVPRRFTLRDYLDDAGIGVVGIGLRAIAIVLLTFMLVTAG
jgi:predicted PurR-regulated permease PerM